MADERSRLGRVKQVPVDFARGPSEIPPQPTVEGGIDELPFSSGPEELAGATEGYSNVRSSQYIIDVWTGSKMVRWGYVFDTAEGCDNLPPDFMGGCDPLYRRYYVERGGMLTPDYDR